VLLSLDSEACLKLGYQLGSGFSALEEASYRFSVPSCSLGGHSGLSFFPSSHNFLLMIQLVSKLVRDFQLMSKAPVIF
jgi:hypothetical protein